MAKARPPSQGWRTFLHNHADGIASMDLFVVPTVSFRLLYGILIRQHPRRELLWLGVTAHPPAEWIAQQLVEAFGWREISRYMVRDRDCIYGARFVRCLRAMGIRDRPTAARSLRDLSAQSDESASTTSSSSANDISGLCYTITRTITMNVERTYRWTRILHSRAQFSSTAALPPTLFLADCTINIVEFEFSIGTGPYRRKRSGKRCTGRSRRTSEYLKRETNNSR
jgi:hypothetical protein